jgi:hypothetical protein
MGNAERRDWYSAPPSPVARRTCPPRTMKRMATSLPPPEAPPPSAPRSDFAVASFVLGLLSVPFYLFGIFSILAVIVGVLGLRKPPRALPNIVLASTGIALGALSFLMGLVMVGVGR